MICKRSEDLQMSVRRSCHSGNSVGNLTVFILIQYFIRYCVSDELEKICTDEYNSTWCIIQVEQKISVILF